MKRLPVAAFVALAIVTVAAFFFIQHLKVSTPLIAGQPSPHPSTINPVSGGVCPSPGPHGTPIPTSFREMKISFYLLNRNDDVDVSIVRPDNLADPVATIASNVPMVAKPRPKRHQFVWNGRLSDGRVAPDGTYDVKVTLLHQGRSYVIAEASTGTVLPVVVQTKPPSIRVTSVSGPGDELPAVIPASGDANATIRYAGTDKLRPLMQIYRSSATGRLHLVKTYFATKSSGTSVWDGTLTHRRPAPQGTYLVGMKLIDATCNRIRWPATLHPESGSTDHAGVTVRYLAAEPPLTPVSSGHAATVEVDSRQHRYTWALRRAGAARVLSSGSSESVSLSVKLPGGGAGLYGLALRWGSHRIVVPLIAGTSGSGAGSGSAGAAGLSPTAHGHVLVVLPTLSWQGLNPVDDDGDGIPNTLLSGEPVRLNRPLVTTPLGFAQEASLLAYLRRAGLQFDLTTDLAYADGAAAPLGDYSGVVLAGDERWVTPSFGDSLARYVQQGGRILSFGIGSLQRSVTIDGGQALHPSPAHRVDFLDGRPLAVTSSHGTLLLVQTDKLGLFRGGASPLSGYRTYQPFGPPQPPARLLSSLGVSDTSPAVIGYSLGHGRVVNIGLPGFASTLAHHAEAQALLRNVWSLLLR